MGNTKGKELTGYQADYVVFDLETTGISVMKDEIIEISAVKVKDGQVIDTFSTLVNPLRDIPYAATAVNGITDEMVKNEPDLIIVLPRFLEFIKGFVLVGHNIKSFDMKFIDKAVANLFGEVLENDFIDTLPMARKYLPQLAHHRLVDVSEFFQIETKGAHRALNDCMMNQQCFEELGKIQQTVKVKVCPRCNGELVRRSGKYGVFMGCSNYPSCKYTERI